MLQYTVRRIFVMIPTLVVISALVFTIIQLPEGDYLTSYIAELEATGEKVSQEKVEFLRQQYGLDRPVVEQYAALGAGHAAGGISATRSSTISRSARWSGTGCS